MICCPSTPGNSWILCSSRKNVEARCFNGVSGHAKEQIFTAAFDTVEEREIFTAASDTVEERGFSPASEARIIGALAPGFRADGRADLHCRVGYRGRAGLQPRVRGKNYWGFSPGFRSGRKSRSSLPRPIPWKSGASAPRQRQELLGL